MFINFHTGAAPERIESFPTDDESMSNVASIQPVFIDKMSKEEEQRLSLDQLKMWPVDGGDDIGTNHQSTGATDNGETDAEAAFAARRKALTCLQEAGFQLDQLVTITKMLKKKEYITLEACSRSLKNEDEEEKVLSFVNSLHQNARKASEAVERRMKDVEEIIKRRRKFISDCKRLQNLGWNIKRTNSNDLGIECSPGWEQETVPNSLNSIKVLKAGYVKIYF